MRRVLPLVLACLAAAGPGPARATGLPAGAQACQLQAWSSDRDPKGLNVRAEPRADAPVVARLPVPRPTGGASLAVQVSVVGSRDGWFLIERAAFDGEAPGSVFEGRGWVSGRLLSLLPAGPILRAGPAATARTVAEIAREDAGGNPLGPDAFKVERLHGCRGEWAEVEGTVAGPGTRLRGWATTACAGPATSCG